jgi:thiol-disulfide isomerase/thioredoxin
MATLKERFLKWKETRSVLQKAGDVAFWLLLILLIIPGPRKVISTAINRVVLQIKTPGLMAEEKQTVLAAGDYNWILQDGSGEPFYLQNHRNKVIFLNFWATWCPPCVAELPEIQRAYEKHGEKVEFMLVTNQEPEVVEPFLQKHSYKLPVLYARTPAPQVFEHGSIPTTYIISGEGKIAVKKSGAVNWDSRGTDRIFDKLVR